jgi:hypothetical protein
MGKIQLANGKCDTRYVATTAMATNSVSETPVWDRKTSVCEGRITPLQSHALCQGD